MRTSKMKRLISLSLICSMVVVCLFSTGITVHAEDTLPAKFDLRDKGVVTPVKLQNPWGSCWSFAGIAAAETSILSDLGITNEDYKKANNGEDFDLSEKHLAYFAQRPITDKTSPTQAGEGLYVFNADKDPNYPYTSGGWNIEVSTLFSSGVGPLLENMFPYKGATGLTALQFAEKYPDKVKDAVAALFKEYFKDTIDVAYKKLINPEYDEKTKNWIKEFDEKELFKEYPDKTKITYDEFYNICYKYYVADLKAEGGNSSYSESDDWTIPEIDEDGVTNRDLFAGYTLLHGNVLPEMAKRDNDNKWIEINKDGIKAAKSELMKGHGVAVCFAADQSTPADNKDMGQYMNFNTYAHYTYESKDSNHAVCIIGWDDNYSKENFVTGHEPPEDGAWIVKNSWGSETDYTDDGNGVTIGKSTWGVKNEQGKHTGYFYISYYDQSIVNPETFSFGDDLAKYEDDGFDVWAYDFMPAMSSLEEDMSISSDTVVKTANIFGNFSDNIQSIKSVSTKTSKEDAAVEYNIYRIDKDFDNPEDGTLVATKKATYEYKGFHREKLDGSIEVAPGEAIAIVVTETSQVDGKTQYGYGVNAANNEIAAKKNKDDRYGVAIVNAHESYLYDGTKWIDWKDSIQDLKKSNDKLNNLSIDNFSIRSYAVDVSKAIYRLYNPNSGEHFYTRDEEEKNYLDNIGWDYESISWQSTVDKKIPVYRVYSPATGDHHYTTDAAERDMLVSLGWKDEGVSQYATVDGRAIYRVFNPNTITAGSHHYTASPEERDMLVSLGWKDEGIGWYAY